MTDFFDSGLDYQPLLDIGLTNDQAKKMVAVVMPLVQLKLQQKVEEALGADKMIELKQKADEKKSDFMGSLTLIDAAYRKKTGGYVMEEVRLLINEHLRLMAQVITKAKSDEAKFQKSGLSADEAAKLLEKELKND